TRRGIAASADYKLGAFSSLYAHVIYSNLQDYGDKWYYSPVYNGNPKFYTSSKRPKYAIGSANLGGTHAMVSSAFNWEISAARASELSSAGNPKADFSWIGSKLTCGFDPNTQTNPHLPRFGSGCDDPGTPLQNASNWGYKDLTTSTGLAAQ